MQYFQYFRQQAPTFICLCIANITVLVIGRWRKAASLTRSDCPGDLGNPWKSGAGVYGLYRGRSTFARLGFAHRVSGVGHVIRQSCVLLRLWHIFRFISMLEAGLLALAADRRELQCLPSGPRGSHRHPPSLLFRSLRLSSAAEPPQSPSQGSSNCPRST